MPNLLRAVTPKLSDEDRKVVDNTNKLLAFLLGNLQVTRVFCFPFVCFYVLTWNLIGKSVADSARARVVPVVSEHFVAVVVVVVVV